jgi:hypothetical protein
MLAKKAGRRGQDLVSVGYGRNGLAKLVEEPEQGFALAERCFCLLAFAYVENGADGADMLALAHDWRYPIFDRNRRTVEAKEQFLSDVARSPCPCAAIDGTFFYGIMGTVGVCVMN